MCFFSIYKFSIFHTISSWVIAPGDFSEYSNDHMRIYRVPSGSKPKRLPYPSMRYLKIGEHKQNDFFYFVFYSIKIEIISIVWKKYFSYTCRVHWTNELLLFIWIFFFILYSILFLLLFFFVYNMVCKGNIYAYFGSYSFWIWVVCLNW
jgi:hypothetical protein